jgi:hypothetical protein
MSCNKSSSNTTQLLKKNIKKESDYEEVGYQHSSISNYLIHKKENSLKIKASHNISTDEIKDYYYENMSNIMSNRSLEDRKEFAIKYIPFLEYLSNSKNTKDQKELKQIVEYELLSLFADACDLNNYTRLFTVVKKKAKSINYGDISDRLSSKIESVDSKVIGFLKQESGYLFRNKKLEDLYKVKIALNEMYNLIISNDKNTNMEEKLKSIVENNTSNTYVNLLKDKMNKYVKNKNI